METSNPILARLRWGRRRLLAGIVACVPLLTSIAAADAGPYDAMGQRVGEVTSNSAIVHVRLTKNRERNSRGFHFPIWVHSIPQATMRTLSLPDGLEIEDLEGSVPGQAGQARLHYGLESELGNSTQTPWADIGPQTDFTHEFALSGLRSNQTYFYQLEMRRRSRKSHAVARSGSFERPPILPSGRMCVSSSSQAKITPVATIWAATIRLSR